MKPDSVTKKSTSFEDVKNWYEDNMAGEVIDYDDQHVYENVYHKGKFGGIFQLTSKGAQNLFLKGKPRSIVDIAALTSIYRPGPLASNVDKMYIEAGDGGKAIDWGHPAFDKALGETRNLLVFQEQMMGLAVEVGGFDPIEADAVRKAIAKRSIKTKDAAAQKLLELEERFVKGASKKGITEKVAREGFALIQKMSGYGFNKSHAVAYAIGSYNCAWLMTYFEEEWLIAYLEGMSVSDDKRAKAFGEVKALGYSIIPIDTKYASRSWTIAPGKKFMPSMLSCKGVGESAIDEFQILRKDAHEFTDIFWDSDGKWLPSKFNKRALEALINVRAWESYDIVGKHKLFDNYHHMHEVMIVNNNEIKKRTKKDPSKGQDSFYRLIDETRGIKPWSREEMIDKSVHHFGSADISTVFPQHMQDKFSATGCTSIDDYNKKDIYWFIVKKATPKQTRNGKPYLLIECQGALGKAYKMFCWSWDGSPPFKPFSVLYGEVSKSDFGFATSRKKLKALKI